MSKLTSIKSRYLGLFTFVILLVCFRFCFVCFLGWICVPVKIETSWTEILALYPLIPPKKLKLWAKKLVSSAKLRKCRELVNSREKYLILWHMLALILSEITSKLRYLEGNVTNGKMVVLWHWWPFPPGQTAPPPLTHHTHEQLYSSLMD